MWEGRDNMKHSETMGDYFRKFCQQGNLKEGGIWHFSRRERVGIEKEREKEREIDIFPGVPLIFLACWWTSFPLPKDKYPLWKCNHNISSWHQAAVMHQLNCHHAILGTTKREKYSLEKTMNWPTSFKVLLPDNSGNKISEVPILACVVFLNPL